MARNRSRATDRARIRKLFLEAVETYTVREAAELLSMSPRELVREATLDRREAYRVRGHWRFTWRQVTYIALRRWPLAEIHQALGSTAASVLPPLLALRSLTIQLPEYMVRALEILASDSDTTVDEYLMGELIDFAGTVSPQLARRIPGYRRAYLFPSEE